MPNAATRHVHHLILGQAKLGVVIFAPIVHPFGSRHDSAHHLMRAAEGFGHSDEGVVV
jgi:hypothetical protein